MITLLNAIIDIYSRDYNECLYSSEIKTFSSSLKYTAFSNPAAIGSLYEDENLRDLMKNAILPTATIINRSPITTPVIANTTLGLSVKDDIYYIKTQFCQFLSENVNISRYAARKTYSVKHLAFIPNDERKGHILQKLTYKTFKPCCIVVCCASDVIHFYRRLYSTKS